VRAMRRLRRKLLRGALVFICALNFRAAFAATDGVSGPSSTGTLQLSVDVPHLLRFSITPGINVVSYGAEFLEAGARDLCIYANVPPPTYLISARGSGENGAFSIQGEDRKQITYALRLRETKSARNDVWLRPNSPVVTTQVRESTACMEGASADLELTVPSLADELRHGVTFEGSMQLFIEPY
jgi:hypothetical protein